MGGGWGVGVERRGGLPCTDNGQRVVMVFNPPTQMPKAYCFCSVSPFLCLPVGVFLHNFRYYCFTFKLTKAQVTGLPFGQSVTLVKR